MRSMVKVVMTTIALGCGSAALAAGPALDTDRQKLGYTIGFQIGNNIKQEGIDLDVDALGLAIKDVLAGTAPRLAPEQMQAALHKMQMDMEAERERLAQENLEAGRKFLAENKKRKGVTETASGLQYEVKKDGTGAQPKPTDTVVVHYRGTLIDGTEFDSSHSRGEPVTFPVNGVIPGWSEALPMMKEGAEWKVYIPSELAYGPRGVGDDIPPNSVLIFDIQLLSIEKPEAATP